MAVLRSEHEALREDLIGWDLRVAYKGDLRPWRRGSVGPPENAIWARPRVVDQWHLDFKIELDDGDQWVYRRDPTVRRPLSEIGHVIDGVPFLAPELARLYQAR